MFTVVNGVRSNLIIRQISIRSWKLQSLHMFKWSKTYSLQSLVFVQAFVMIQQLVVVVGLLFGFGLIWFLVCSRGFSLLNLVWLTELFARSPILALVLCFLLDYDSP